MAFLELQRVTEDEIIGFALSGLLVFDDDL